MSRTKTLSERFVNLYQQPYHHTPNFEGDLLNGELLEPVEPNAVSYLAMTFQLLKPKIGIDLEALQTTNLSLASSTRESGYVGSSLQASDALMQSAEDYLTVFDTLDFVPALTLYVNPSDINRNFTKRSSSQTTGGGHVTEHWGNDQDKLSASGKIGAMFTAKTGITRYFRRNTAGYQQLMHLKMIYRNNGYIYEPTDAHRIGMVGRVQITYDTETWIGHFDSFQLNETADNPYTMDYSFEFTVREYTNDESLR